MERCINKIRAWRDLAMRYRKTPASYMAGLQLRGSNIWIRSRADARPRRSGRVHGRPRPGDQWQGRRVGEKGWGTRGLG